jgi:hypothetical protein
VLDDLLDQTGLRLVGLQRHGSILSLDSCSASAAPLSRSRLLSRGRPPPRSCPGAARRSSGTRPAGRTCA